MEQFLFKYDRYRVVFIILSTYQNKKKNS